MYGRLIVANGYFVRLHDNTTSENNHRRLKTSTVRDGQSDRWMDRQTDTHDGIGRAYAQHRVAIKGLTACTTTKYYAATCVLLCVQFVEACLWKDDRRFVNDSALQESLCNARAVSMVIKDLPRILFFARKDIPAGSEIRFDYQGEDMPWRKVRWSLYFCTVKFYLF